MPEAMTEQHDLRRLLKTLRASIWLILLLVVIAGAGAYAVSLATPARYRSAETLIYLPAGGTIDVTTDTATRDLETAVGLVQAAPVLAPSAKRLGVTQDELRASVSGVLPTNSNLLRIEATAATAVGAQNRAVTVAKVFQQFRLGLQRRAIDARINAIKTQIQKLSPAANNDAAAQIRSLRDQLSLSVSDRAVANGDFVIGDPARLPTAAFQPQPTRNAVLGAVAGLLIGIAAAFGRARLNRRLNTVADVESAYGMQAIGAIPPPGFHELDRAGHIVGDFEGSSPLVEAFRSTRATLSLYSVGSNGKPVVIAVTSANGGEGKTTVVANLAMAMATSGKRVLAISADLRKPSLHGYFPESARAGLLDVLSGRLALRDATGWVSLNGSTATGGRLGVLATNARFRDPARLFESADIGLVLDHARLDYDIILIDCPPLLQTPEASIIAGIADGSLIVGRAGGLTRDDAQHALERLSTANASPLGVIVSNARERRTSYGYGNEDETS
ncbi:MAG: tyrosine-protein kinase [Gaiellales bacterium]|nr:tyrosine-protein kinase [Gaiellales bacterium]